MALFGGICVHDLWAGVNKLDIAGCLHQTSDQRPLPCKPWFLLWLIMQKKRNFCIGFGYGKAHEGPYGKLLWKLFNRCNQVNRLLHTALLWQAEAFSNIDPQKASKWSLFWPSHTKKMWKSFISEAESNAMRITVKGLLPSHTKLAEEDCTQKPQEMNKKCETLALL